MTDLRALLEQAKVRSVLIVDDAYDHVPLARDLSLDRDELTHFFEDVTDDDREALREIYPQYEETRADELQGSDEFVAALWQNRGRIRTDLIYPLFQRYENDKANDQEYLATLVERLGTYGLTCETSGRHFQEHAFGVDLIIIDMYLGPAQDELALRASIDGLTKVIADRPNRPPLVVLMSRSNLLEDKREEFRDTVGLFESAFRIIRKAELVDSGKLQRLLTRLASHYIDSLKLASFLCAWNDGLDQARKRTSRLIRTLDLADYAQIRQLLLSAEGEPTGSYVVDIFDRVLQYEVESETPIIDAAIALNALTSETYPPPYVAGSRDLQNLVYRSLFQNRERLRLIGAEASPVAFGDLLRRKFIPKGMGTPPASPGAHSPLDDISEAEVLAVLSPACDLQRQGAKRILLLVGTLSPLQPADWTYKEDRTPVIELVEGQRSWIKWNLKHIETVSHAELKKILEIAGGFEIVARMRESHALELQQKLLSNLGRVGQIAPMPATFPMRVKVYLRDRNQAPELLDIPALEDEGGVCYVGRSDQGDRLDRLVLCEAACEGICEAIEKVTLTQFHRNAQETLKYLRTNGEQLAQALEQGIWLPNDGKRKEISLPSDIPQDNDSAAKSRSIGFVTRNMTIEDAHLQKSGLVLATWDESVAQKQDSGSAEPSSVPEGQEPEDSEPR